MRQVSRRGRPTIAQADAERCEALTVMTEWKVDHKKEQRCPLTAKFGVQGKFLCRHHAVLEALAISIERGDVKRLMLPPPQTGSRVATAGQVSGTPEALANRVDPYAPVPAAPMQRCPVCGVNSEGMKLHEGAAHEELVEAAPQDAPTRIERSSFLGNQHLCTVRTEELDRLEAERDALQAKLDALMLEHCPEDMTPERVAEWGKHQRPIDRGDAVNLARNVRGVNGWWIYR